MTFLILQKIKISLLLLFSIKDLKKASVILEMKIYRDRSKWLLGLSQSNIHKVFMSRIYPIMYTIYEIEYGILTRIVSEYLQDFDEITGRTSLGI